MILSPRRRAILLALALSATVLNLVDRQIISVLKPTIAADLGWSDNDYGTLAAYFQGAAAVAYLFAGWIVDKLGVKRANAWAVSLWSLAAMTHAWARTFAQFVICRIALGATEAMGTPAAIKTIATIYPPQLRSAGYGYLNTVGSIGAILTPLLIPLVAALWGWRATFIVGGVLGLVWSLLWLWALRGVQFGDTQADAPKAEKGRSVLAEGRNWAIAAAKFLSDATWWLMLFWMPDFFHRSFGLEGVALGPPLAIAYGCAALGAFLAGVTATRLIGRGYETAKVRKTSLLVGALLATPLIFANAAQDYWLVVAILGLVMAGHQVFSVNLFALISDVSPTEKVGRVTSFGAFAGNIGGMVIVKVAGLTLAAGLGYAPLFLFAGCSYLMAVGILHLALPTGPGRMAAAPAAS